MSSPHSHMSSSPKETDAQRDEALDESFPASDPPSIGGSTGPNDAKPKPPVPPVGNDPPLQQGLSPASY